MNNDYPEFSTRFIPGRVLPEILTRSCMYDECYCKDVLSLLLLFARVGVYCGTYALS